MKHRAATRRPLSRDGIRLVQWGVSACRAGALLGLLAGCGPAVGPPGGGASGAHGTAGMVGTTVGSSSAATTTGASESTASANSTETSGSSSSGGEPAKLVELEGVWRYNEGWMPSPFSFQECNGNWTRVVFSPENSGSVTQDCSGIYTHVRGHFQPSASIYGGDEFLVSEVLVRRPCEPLDCGGDACEALRCPWDCSPLDQDCHRSKRCVPYPTDGGIASAAACVPIPETPNRLGESCSRDAANFSADTCGAGAVCMGGFGKRTGICVELCRGSDSEPTCSVGRCTFGNMGAPYCLPECDPLMPVCDGVCTASPFDPSGSCVPEPGLPELLEACGERGCEDGFTCSLAGPTEGLCIPLR